MHTSGGGARAAVEITGPARAAYADARRGLAALSAGGAVEGENGDPRGVQSRRGEECFDSGQPKGLVEAAVDGRARPTRAGNNLTSAASGSARRGVGVRRSGGSELKIHARVEQRRRGGTRDGVWKHTEEKIENGQELVEALQMRTAKSTCGFKPTKTWFCRTRVLKYMYM